MNREYTVKSKFQSNLCDSLTNRIGTVKTEAREYMERAFVERHDAKAVESARQRFSTRIETLRHFRDLITIADLYEAQRAQLAFEGYSQAIFCAGSILQADLKDDFARSAELKQIDLRINFFAK